MDQVPKNPGAGRQSADSAVTSKVSFLILQDRSSTDEYDAWEEATNSNLLIYPTSRANLDTLQDILDKEFEFGEEESADTNTVGADQESLMYRQKHKMEEFNHQVAATSLF